MLVKLRVDVHGLPLCSEQSIDLLVSVDIVRIHLGQLLELQNHSVQLVRSNGSPLRGLTRCNILMLALVVSIVPWP